MRPFEFGRSFLFIGACIGIVGCSPAQFDLDLRDNAYSTTEAARRTLDRRPTPDQQGIITYPLFKSLVRLEAERQKITNSSISLSYVNFVLSTETMKKHLNNYKEFVIEVIMLFRNLLKPIDIITVPVEDIILIFSPESKSDETKQRLRADLEQVKGALVMNKKMNEEKKKTSLENEVTKSD